MVEVYGTDVRKYSLNRLRKKIAVVPQKAVLFSGTIRENMKWGGDNITDEQIWRALKISQAYEFVEKLENGLDYKILQGGKNLSGGQKQRSSIARALLKNAPVLIMDDSLSAVDTDTEEQILENLIRLRKGKTTIIIAHRVSTLQKADHIAVLTEGEMTEYGTHDELIREGGFYAKIYEKQQLEQELNEM